MRRNTGGRDSRGCCRCGSRHRRRPDPPGRRGLVPVTGRVVVLTGGVGGAKLVAGLISAVGVGRVTAIVNTGDDFTHLGLRVSPDIDTLLYTLSGLADPLKGWGRAGETWS